MIITVKCKLNPDKRQAKILDRTLSKCLDALNYISKIAWKKKCWNRVALHHLVYYRVRKKFNLPADITCTIKDKVAFTYRADRKRQHIFKNSLLPLRFERTLSIKNLGIASISTIKGRQKIPLVLGEHQEQMISKASDFCDSDIIKRGKKFYLNLVIEIPDKAVKKIKDVLGVDLGIKNIAVCSNGQKFTGEQVQSVRNRYSALKSQLMSKGTRSAKRHLKKMSGREKRFQKDINHQVSKQIVELAIQRKSAIALEDLKNIRKNARHRKSYRGTFHRWAFCQLRQFITYKAQMAGIPVKIVSPAYTSQTCSSCGKLGSRRGQSFHCRLCSFQSNTDYNASLNIRRVAFSQPIVATPC